MIRCVKLVKQLVNKISEQTISEQTVNWLFGRYERAP